MAFRHGHLRYFVTIAEEGQITRAAQRLRMAQPALSQALRQLETELGFRLLERHPRGVTLTAAGAAFYEKARIAVATAAEAEQTAESLARAEEGTIEFGFLGAAPGVDSPGPLEQFVREFPGIDLRYRELPFPSLPTSRWLSEVDVAVCHAPPAEPSVWSQTLRLEPRVLIAPARHALAAHPVLEVAEVLDTTFIGIDPGVAPEWAGFWSLDDHRGEPAPNVTPDRAANPQEVLAALAVRDAVTTVPASIAAASTAAAPGLRAVPLRDAAPAEIVLLGHTDSRNPLAARLLEFARSFGRPG